MPCNRFSLPLTLAICCFLSRFECWAVPPAILPSALPTITLSGSGSGNNTGSIAYHPGFNQYYGSHIGNPGFSGHVWDAAGNPLQTTTLGTDSRSFNYNANNNTIEIVSYSAISGGGLYTLGLTGSGLMTGSNPLVFGPLTGLSDDQTMPAYDSDLNRLYSRSVGNVVNIVDRTNGNLITTVNLDLAAAGSPSLQDFTLGFDDFFDVFVTLDVTNLRALAHDLNGNYLGASTLPPATPFSASYNMGYANGQLFVSQAGGSFAYRGFRIFSEIPEPTGFMLLTGMALAWGLRRLG